MNKEELLQSILAIEGLIVREKVDRAAVIVPAQRLIEIMQRLKAEPQWSFDLLYTHTAIDWPAKQQIELIYQLYSTSNNQSLMVAVDLPRIDPLAPSVSALWRIAEWQEREVYDLFGVKYTGHPDLRRILLDDDWQGHPLLKDYKDDFMLERPW